MQDKHEAIISTVNEIATSLTELRELMKEPADLYFGRLHPAIEHLENAMGKKTTIDAAFAFLAARDDAGRTVGSSKPEDYLTARLGLTYPEAQARIKTGQSLFAPLSEEAAADAPASAHPSATGSDSETAEQKREDATRERARREREAAEKRRRQMLEEEAAHARTIALIEQELEHLTEGALPGRQELSQHALEKSREMSHTALRAWLREAIRAANKSVSDADAVIKKRRLRISQPDADGGVFISGYVDAATAAMLKAAFAPARHQGGPNLSAEEDSRTYSQRMADQLSAIVHSYLESHQHGTGGVGSLLITTTLNELEEMDSSTRFATNAGVELSPLDLLRIGAASHDFIGVVDDKKFPLELGRCKRSASLYQKIALAASELVCTHPGCDRPWVECDVHHLHAWAAGGATDLKNLTLLCRRHHADNNDRRDGFRNMGHAERDPITRRVGYRPAGSERIHFNDSPAAHKAPAHKLSA